MNAMKIISVGVLVLGISPGTGAIDCPATQSKYQAILYQQGYIHPQQTALLNRECYMEIQRSMSQAYSSVNPSPQSSGDPVCQAGIYQGYPVHPDRCLLGQSLTILKDLFN